VKVYHLHVFLCLVCLYVAQEDWHVNTKFSSPPFWAWTDTCTQKCQNAHLGECPLKHSRFCKQQRNKRMCFIIWDPFICLKVTAAYYSCCWLSPILIKQQKRKQLL